MIRSTRNVTISAAAKERTFGGGLLAGVYPRGTTYELVYDSIDSSNKEYRDAINIHPLTVSLFPSNAFNGTFE